VIVCGGGVILAGGTAALAVFTEKLDIPVCTTVSGQGSLAETHPNCAGVVGSNGGQPAIRSLVDEADLIFYIGCRAGSVTTERWRSPKAGTTVVHMDNDPAVIGACYQTKAAMVCDARLGLEALILELGAVFGKNGTVRVLAAKTEKWKAFAPLAVSNKMPIKPERVLADLAKHLPDDAVVCADPGTPCPYFSAWFEWRKPGRYFITNRAHGALGFAIGASIGAQIGRPNAKVICATGDGSFGMSVGELETMKRLNLPITILVFSNSVFGWIKAGQKSGFGARYFSVDFSRTDHAAVAAAYGIKSFTASDPSDLAAIFKKAVHFDGPTLVDIICEPLQDTAAPVSEWVA
jgi:acetolactate synthase-1/2/3 large subunit